MTRSGFIAPVVILPNPSWDVRYFNFACSYDTMYQPFPQWLGSLGDYWPFLCPEDTVMKHAIPFMDRDDSAREADSDKAIAAELDPHAVCAIRTRLGSHNDATRCN